MSRNIFLALLILFSFSFISADYVGVKDCYNITELCYNCSNIEIDSIIVGNDIITINELMDNVGSIYYYEYCNTSKIGTYKVNLLKNYSDSSIGINEITFNVNQYGVEDKTFYTHTLFYIVLLFASILFVYKYASFNGVGHKNTYMYFWASFFNLAIFVLMTIYPLVSGNLLLEVLQMLFLATGVYFFAEGVFGVFYDINRKR